MDYPQIVYPLSEWLDRQDAETERRELRKQNWLLRQLLRDLWERGAAPPPPLEIEKLIDLSA